jgi:anti-sigma factor RsiW
MTCESTARLLDRHLDGELPEAERSMLEEHIRSCPACALETLRRRELQTAVREAGAAFVPSARLTEGVLARLRQDGRPSGRVAPPWRLPLAALLLVGLALAAVWTGSRTAGRARLVTPLVDLHLAALADTPLDVLSSDAHTVKPWFEGKIPFAFDLPDLTDTGWELAGGRLVRVDGAPAAQLILGIRRHRVSVVVFVDPDATGAGLSSGGSRETSRGFRLLSWSANGLRYVAVSDTGAEDLETLADRFLRASRS